MPESGIIDFVSVTNKLAELITDINQTVKSSIPVKSNLLMMVDLSIPLKDNTSRIKKFCGGLFSDRLAQKDKVHSDVRIVGFRGDYYDLSEKGKS